MDGQCLYEPLADEVVCVHKRAKGYQTYSYHRHNGYEVYLFLEGNILFYHGSNCYKLVPGDLLIIPPSCMHRIISIDESIYDRIVLNIRHSAIERLSTGMTNLFTCFELTDTDNIMPINLNKEEIERFTQLSEGLISSMKDHTFGSDVLANSYVSQLLLMINKSHNVSPEPKFNIMPELVKNVMLYIEENLAGDLRLSKISEEFYHNGTYISRMFKKHTGLTLKEYIIDQRIEAARKILKHGGSVQEACYKSGFSDYSNFIRSYTAAMGVSPGKYKQENNKKNAKK